MAKYILVDEEKSKVVDKMDFVSAVDGTNSAAGQAVGWAIIISKHKGRKLTAYLRVGNQK